MNDLVNRLELLLHLIVLGEYDLLKPQAEKLRTDTDDERVEAIIEVIEARDFPLAVDVIGIRLVTEQDCTAGEKNVLF